MEASPASLLLRAPRARKTKAPCEVCYLHRDRCMCALLPRLDLKTRLCLIIHAKELKRTTNTGRLAVRCLVNSEMRVRGDDRSTLDLSDLLNPALRTVLFYPSEDAIELDRRFVEQDSRPIQLIVPDGNWRQASKVHTRHKELVGIPRVTLPAVDRGAPVLRAESKTEGMATLEAIAEAFRVIEGEDVGARLRGVYQIKLQRTLEGRGISPSTGNVLSGGRSHHDGRAL